MQDVEGEVQHKPRRLGAQPLPAPLPDGDPELSTPVRVVDLKQPRGPDRRAISAIVDRELDALRFTLASPLNVVVNPFLLVLGGGDTAVVKDTPDLQLVRPARVSGGQDRAGAAPTRPSRRPR